MEMRKLGYDPMLLGYTDTSMDPRQYHPNDPALKTYAGTLPALHAARPRQRGRRCLDSVTQGQGLQDRRYARAGLHADRETILAPRSAVPPYPPPPGFKSVDSETSFVVDPRHRLHGEQEGIRWFLHVSILQPHPPFVATEPYNKLYDADKVPPFRGFADPADEEKLHPYVAFSRGNYRAREGHNPEKDP